MQNRIFIFVLSLFLSGNVADARVFAPTVSLLASYTSTYNYTEIESGIFNIQNRKINFGFEATNKFYFTKDIFFKTGLRYNQYSTTINAVNQISVLMDNPYPFVWTHRLESLCFPLLVGKEFSFNERKGDVYFGMSLGLLMTSYSMTGGTIAFKKDPNNTDLIVYQLEDTNASHTPNYFYPALNLGVTYHPFKKTPRLSIGFLCAIQLNKTKPYFFQGIAQNYSRSETYSYNVQNYQSFINYSMLFSYTFVKPRLAKEKSSSLDCPH